MLCGLRHRSECPVLVPETIELFHMKHALHCPLETLREGHKMIDYTPAKVQLCTIIANMVPTADLHGDHNGWEGEGYGLDYGMTISEAIMLIKTCCAERDELDRELGLFQWQGSIMAPADGWIDLDTRVTVSFNLVVDDKTRFRV